MNNERGKESKENAQKEVGLDKLKNNSNYNPTNEREQQEPYIHSSINNLQNSACKNFKSEMRVEPANFFL